MATDSPPIASSRSTAAYGLGSAGWIVTLAVASAVVLLPVATIIVLSLSPEENIWAHLSTTVLPRYLINTVLLMSGVMCGVCLLGVPTAWLVSRYEFPGWRHFQWLLLLPLAMPAYVVAYVYTDLLEFAGPVQSMLRAAFEWRTSREYWFPSIRSLGGAVCMMSLVLYPYVYMLCRAAFMDLSPNMLDAARVMDLNPRQVFFRIVLPIARPALAVGVALALMETLNDFGTVDFFAVQTLTTGLYDTWLNMGNLGGAAQIALVMLVFVLLLITLERLSRRRQRYYQSKDLMRERVRQPLTGINRRLAVATCALPVLLGFVLPVIVLVRYAVQHFHTSWTEDFRQYAFNSLTLSVTAATIAVILAIVIAYSHRLRADRLSGALFRIAGIGYALPGVVLALGLLIPFATFDNALDAFLRSTFNVSTGLLLSGSLFAVICAYVIRFLAVSIGAIDNSLAQITPSTDMASRSLGYGATSTLFRFHIPLMKSGIFTALVIVFVDCMKELPATLLLRPFNFDTLAVRVYHLAGDELIEQAALSALVIVISGLLPVALLTLSMQPARHRSVTTKFKNDSVESLPTT